MKRLLMGVTAVLAVLLSGLAAGQTASTDTGQTWPSKPIRLIIPLPPGGSADLMGRTVAARLSERLGQQVLVDNRAGAGGNIGVDAVAKAAPDGYTIGIGPTGALVINPHLYANIPYDTLRDLAPISLLAQTPFVLAVHPSLGVNSVREFIALAKAQPGRISVGHGGNGTAMHLAAEQLKLLARIDLNLIPFKGNAPAGAAVAGGQIDAVTIDVPATIAHIKSGRIKALAVTSANRSVSLPEVPSMAEAGVPGYDSTGWFGMIAPAGTPQAILSRLNREIVAILNDPAVKERVITVGCEPWPSTQEEFASLIRNELPKWQRVVKQSGAKAN